MNEAKQSFERIKRKNMTKEEILQELLKLKEEDYSSDALFNNGYVYGIMDAISLVEKFGLADVSKCSECENLIDAYKECFEIYIPNDKWDEATLFLSTYNNGLAKELARKKI